MCWKVIFDKLATTKNVTIYFSFNVKNVKREIFRYFSVSRAFCLKNDFWDNKLPPGMRFISFYLFGKSLVKKQTEIKERFSNIYLSKQINIFRIIRLIQTVCRD